MKFVVGENGRNPEKNLPRPRFVHHETHMEGPRRELGTPNNNGPNIKSFTKKTVIIIIIEIIMSNRELSPDFRLKEIC